MTDHWLDNACGLSANEPYEEALQAYYKVVELNYTPRLKIAWLTKSILLAGRQRHDEALQAANKTTESQSPSRTAPQPGRPRATFLASPKGRPSDQASSGPESRDIQNDPIF